MNTKKSLRKNCLARRNALSREEVTEKSAAILRRLTSIAEIRHAPAILTYLSMGNEVDTHQLVETLLAEGRTPIVPIVEKGGALTWSVLKDREDLQASAYGIPEPTPGKREAVVPPPQAPVVVPGVAFTPSGHRMGHGGGYFDRFLAAHEGLGIGIAFEAQIIPGFPLEAHDIPVDRIVTESRILICQ